MIITDKDEVTWEFRTLLQPLVFFNDRINRVLAAHTSEKIQSKFLFINTDTTEVSFSETLLYYPENRCKYGYKDWV